MKLEVPYVSQHNDVSDEKWKRHSCPIVCVYMVLKFMKEEDDKIEIPEAVDDLIYEGFELRGTGDYGWTHDSLVWLLHNHGVSAYREEFKSIDDSTASRFRDIGIEKIKKSIESGFPVVVSGIKGWNEEKKFHTFLFTGLAEGKSKNIEGFYYHDPDSYSEKDGAHQYIPLDLFKEKWRKMAIFVYK